MEKCFYDYAIIGGGFSGVILAIMLGESKASILRRVINANEAMSLPAAYIISKAQEAIIYTDLQVSIE